MGAPLVKLRYEELRIELYKTVEGADVFGTRSLYLPEKGESVEVQARHSLPFPIGTEEPSVSGLARALRGSRMATRFDSSSEVQLVGAALFESLFSGGLARVYSKMCSRAEAARAGARIRLAFPDPSSSERGLGFIDWLASLPWEAMYDLGRKDFVALMPYLSIVRSSAQGGPSRLLRPSPLSPGILVIATDLEDGRLGAAREVEALSAMAKSHDAPSFDVIWHPSPEALLAAIRETRAGIVHFTGTLLAADPTRIPLSPESGRPLTHGENAFLPGAQLADALRENGSVQLFYLSACHSARIARSLLSVVPAAVGVQGLIMVDSAADFARPFYDAVLSGTSLDVAMADARRDIDRAYPGLGDWALPVLVTNDRESRIVTSQERPVVVHFLADSAGADLEKLPAVQIQRAFQRIARTNIAALAALAKSTPHAAVREQLAAEDAKLAKARAELEALGVPPEVESS